MQRTAWQVMRRFGGSGAAAVLAVITFGSAPVQGQPPLTPSVQFQSGTYTVPESNVTGRPAGGHPPL